MNDKIKIAITIGIMCMLLTCAILIQLHTIREATQIVGTSYAEESLKDEVLRWKENYESLYKDLEEAEKELETVRQEVTSNNSRGTELEAELTEANKLLGLTELQGSGVIVTLSDNEEVTAKDLGIEDDISKYLIHNNDVINIVNELFNAGAEAISINGQRIITTTAIDCIGSVVTINGEKVSSPFKISAIGNPESLSGIARPGGYFEVINTTGGVATIEKSNNVTVAKYEGTISSEYMTNING